MSNSKNNQNNSEENKDQTPGNQQPNEGNTSKAEKSGSEAETEDKIKELEEQRNVLQSKLDEIEKEKVQGDDKDAKIIELQSKLDEVSKLGENLVNTGSKKPAADVKPLKLKHNDEKYEYPGTEAENYIVRHSRFEKLSSGKEVEDPGSVRIQIYRPEVYEDLVYENEKTGKRNAFVAIGEKAIVLHDPTK